MIFLKAESYRRVDSGPCVLLDGCFDPIHLGHVQQIRAARMAFPEARIVVGVAADDDIRQKGREPVFGQMARCAVVDGLQGVDVVLAKDRPLHALIAALRPVALVKGADWEGRLPDEVSAACALHGIPIVYLGARQDSSTDRLRRWAAEEDARYLARLEQIVASQQPPSEPWRPVTDYSFEARKAIEGEHPRLIKDVFQPKRVLDVGCGEGHLMTLLEGLGVKCIGMDPRTGNRLLSDRIGDDSIAAEWPNEDWGESLLDHYRSDLVVCREVLEHLTVAQIAIAARNLCKLSSKYVYVTTRFTTPPAHLLQVDTSDDLDPTHISMLNQDLLRTLFVLNGGKRRKDLEDRLDWQQKGRVLVYETCRT